MIHRRGDHVGVATTDIAAGERVTGIYMDDDSATEVVAGQDIPLGHKIAVVRLQSNEPVLKYGVPIGYALSAIDIGDYVHIHNIKTARW